MRSPFNSSFDSNLCFHGGLTEAGVFNFEIDPKPELILPR